MGADFLPAIQIFQGGQLDGCRLGTWSAAPGVQVCVLHPVGPSLGFIDPGQCVGSNRTEGVEFYFQGADINGGGRFLAGVVLLLQAAGSFPKRWWRAKGASNSGWSGSCDENVLSCRMHGTQLHALECGQAGYLDRPVGSGQRLVCDFGVRAAELRRLQ